MCQYTQILAEEDSKRGLLLLGHRILAWLKKEEGPPAADPQTTAEAALDGDELTRQGESVSQKPALLTRCQNPPLGQHTGHLSAICRHVQPSDCFGVDVKV
jgi:hypothetical protein